MRTITPVLLAALLATLPLAAPAQNAAGGMSLDQVDPNDPFGEIDVTLTMLDPKTIEAWAGGLEGDRQAELNNRCEFMLANEGRYDIAGRSFCRTLLGR